MKKTQFAALSFAAALLFGFTACSDDDSAPEAKTELEVNPELLEFTALPDRPQQVSVTTKVRKTGRRRPKIPTGSTLRPKEIP